MVSKEAVKVSGSFLDIHFVANTVFCGKQLCFELSELSSFITEYIKDLFLKALSCFGRLLILLQFVS